MEGQKFEVVGGDWLMTDKVQRMVDMLNQFPMLGFGDSAVMHLSNPDQEISFVTFCISEEVKPGERKMAEDVGERLVNEVAKMVCDAQDAGATMYCRRKSPEFIISSDGVSTFVRVVFRGLFLQKYPGRPAAVVIVGWAKPEGEPAPEK